VSDQIIDEAYKLIKPIGKGGMATVYLAEVDISKVNYTLLYAYTQVSGKTHTERVEKADTLASKLKKSELDWKTIRRLLEVQKIPVPPQRVALKLAHENVSIARFEDEWKYLICLNHPNVVKVFCGGVSEQRPYYAMELLPEMISQKEIIENFSVEEKLETICMAGEGLDYLHKNGIVHRDIKPDNFITLKNSEGSMVTKVTDLGLAKDTSAEMGMTGSAVVLGTPYFMSPEQMKSSRDIDHRTDIYSLGASLYEFMTGKKPFHQKSSIVEILKTAADKELPIPPEKHVEGFPKQLSGILKCSMALDVNNRYDSINDFLDDLKKFLIIDPDKLSLNQVISAEFSDLKLSSAEFKYTKKNKIKSKFASTKRITGKDNTPKSLSSTKRDGQKTTAQKRKKRKRDAQQKTNHSGCFKILFYIIFGSALTAFLVIIILFLLIKKNESTQEKIELNAQNTENKNNIIEPAVSSEPEQPKRRGGLKVYKSLQEAPSGGFLIRDKKTGDILDVSGLPRPYRSRYSKNSKDFEVVRQREPSLP
jgi:serine/threonine protein kinase